MSGSTERPSFLGSAVWLILVALAVTGIAVAIHLSRSLGTGARAVGDGSSVASYGFALSPSIVEPARLVSSGMPKDGLKALVAPEIWTMAELENRRRQRRGKLLVGRDLVLGVALGGESRAYPLRLLAWHEAVNDVLGGAAILVTHHPLAGSAAAFRRDSGTRVLEFGISGLLLSSTHLLYDRAGDGGEESLWSPLLPGPISGPALASGAALEPLPSVLTTWETWLARHPDTSVLAPLPELRSHYRREPYGSYLGSDALRFPVEPLPSAGLPLKTPVVAFRLDGGWHAFTHPLPGRQALSGGRAQVTAAGQAWRLSYEGFPPAVALEDAIERQIPVIHAFRFAWHAAHPDDTRWHGDAAPALEAAVSR